MTEMIVCPVCEHPQASGDQCDLCGKRFFESDQASPVSPIEGLERTSQEEVGATEVEPLADLERTVHPPAAAGEERMLELERTNSEAVAVEAEAVPGLEPTSSDSLTWEERTPLVLAPHCRYCRTPANPGEVICSHCGMRLPLFQQAAGTLPEEISWRCPSCSAIVRADVCPGCGGRMPASSGSPLVERT